MLRALRITTACLLGAAALLGPGQAASARPVDSRGAGATPPRWDSAAAARFWTPERMASATPPAVAKSAVVMRPGAVGAQAQHISGVPSVGVLFFVSNGVQAHSCTASVVHSAGKDLILTAGHCNPGTKSAFVPRYTSGAQTQPYGVWAVTRGFRDPRWTAQGPGSDFDFAFATVAPDSTGRLLEDVTGANALARTPRYANQVTVVGYPKATADPADSAISCTTNSGQLPGYRQLKMVCGGYYGGTSGSPWLSGFNGRTGQVIGVLGGLNGGGPSGPGSDRISYSPVFDDQVFALYDDAVHGRAPVRTPLYSLGTPAAWKNARALVSGEFTGDRKGDLVALWADGGLTLYSGDGDGRFTGGRRLLAANGTWTHAASVVAGDFTAAATDDLLVRWADGGVTLYPGVTATGLPRSTVLAKRNTLWTHATTLAAGRFTASGRGSSGLVVRWSDGELSLYTKVGTTGISGEVQLARPGATWRGATALSAGDLAGGNAYDLLVRWSNGGLSVYPDVTGSGLHGGKGLRGADASWAAGLLTAGSYSRNGWPDDVIVRNGSGQMAMFADSGAGGLGASYRLVG